ncbi:MAG: DNA polymerase III subunit gamma/tau [Taibaiella sp.]|nr:DNA polymerase III subunit gamma/tau [Taibaiella sp.]
MSEYIVSARKYRPQTFDTVVGQEHITTTLKNAIRNQHLAHAYLFCGPRGVGKTTCARILSKTINCTSPTADMEACGVCDICQSFKNNTSFNVFELDAASNNSVDDIRELTSQVRFALQHGKYKVYIIDEVHMLSASAFNAFLKMLEEPPSYAIFILATTEKHKILPTILSRCQIFDFKRITTHDIVNHLQSIAVKEAMVAQEASLHIIAQKSEGCMRDALSMLDRIASFTNGILTYNNTMEHLNLLDADYYFELTDNILSQDVSGTLLLLDKAMEKGFEGDVILGGLGEHCRNLLLCKDIRMARLLDVPGALKPVYLEKANQAPPSFILSALNVISQSELEYKNTNNRRLHVEMCLIRLCYLLQAVKGSQVQISGADEVKKNCYNVDNGAQNGSATVNSAFEGQHVVHEPAAFINTPARAPVALPPAVYAQPAELETPPQRRVPAGPARKLSRDMLDDIETTVIAQQRKSELTKQEAQEVFSQYMDQLKADNKSMIHAQFLLMRMEVYPPDEVRFISPSELIDTYALNQRSTLLDFFREKANMVVRITTEIQIDDALKNAVKSTNLSKSEMFEVMATKNPQLAVLREKLGMQLEY